jgi:hypothetical protein
VFLPAHAWAWWVVVVHHSTAFVWMCFTCVVVDREAAVAWWCCWSVGVVVSSVGVVDVVERRRMDVNEKNSNKQKQQQTKAATNKSSNKQKQPTETPTETLNNTRTSSTTLPQAVVANETRPFTVASVDKMISFATWFFSCCDCVARDLVALKKSIESIKGGVKSIESIKRGVESIQATRAKIKA